MFWVQEHIVSAVNFNLNYYTTSVDPGTRGEEGLGIEEVEASSRGAAQALNLSSVTFRTSQDFTPHIDSACNVPEGGVQLDPFDYNESALFSVTTFTRDSGRGRKTNQETELTADQVISRLNGLDQFKEQASTVLAPAFGQQLVNQLVDCLNAEKGDYTFELVDIQPEKRAFFDDQKDKMTRVQAEDVVILRDQFGQLHTYHLSYTWRASTGNVSIEFGKEKA